MDQTECLSIEKRLVQIWSRLLNTQNISRDDNFFSLGGHSLLAIELLSEIENIFLINLSMKDLVEYPTINELSVRILGHAKEVKHQELKQEYQNTNIFPLSINQKQLWNLFGLYPKSLTHNISNAFEIKKKMDIEIVNKVLNRMIEMHPSLRTKFISKNNIPYQEVLPQEKIKLDFIEASREEVLELLEEEMKYNFDLTKGPLIRLEIYKINEEEYVFFFMVHHIVWDGISNTIFFHDFFSLYKKMENQEALDEVKHEVSYKDYVFSQLEFLESQKFNNEKLAWSEYLKGELPVLNLPVDYERTHLINNDSDTVMFDLDQELLSKCEKYARGNRISLYSLFISAYYFLLYSKTRDEEFILGTPVHGRNEKGYRKLVGFFINTLAVRVKLETKKSIKENITAITNSLSYAFSNSSTPLDIVLKNNKTVASPGRTPLFQTLFVYLDITKELDVFEEHKLNIIKKKRQSVHTEIDFYLYKSRFKVECVIEFRKDLYKLSSIEKFGEEFVNVLESVTSDDSQLLNSLGSAPKLINHSVKDPLVEYPTLDDTSYELQNRETTFLGLFKMQAQLHADKIAIKSSSFSLSYRELEAKSNQVANYIKNSSLGRGDTIGVSLERGAELVITLLGIMKSGAAYVPLDPRYPIDRLTYMANKACAKLVFVSKLDIHQKKLGHCVEIKEILKLDLDDKFQHEVIGNDNCYLLFTSGSTGNPKGVVVTHFNVLNFLLSMSQSPGMSQHDHLLSVTSISFDISVLELFLPLIVGGSLFLANDIEVICAESLQSIMAKEKITIMQATPVTWRILQGRSGYVNKELKVLCGGECLQRDLAMTLVKSFKEVWNMYGPTETTVWSLIKRIRETDHKIYIGKPIANTKVYVLDEDHKLQKMGEPGKLFIAGHGVTSGYLDDKTQTDKVFMPNPFMKDDRMYDTGDMARYSFDGELECLGRSDDQVKLRGYRIELGEIEDVILDHPLISQCCVRVENEDLIAYITTDSKNFEFLIDELKMSTKQKLPSYMLPSKILILESMPLTLNGKIDKKNISQDHALSFGCASVKNTKGSSHHLVNIEHVVEDVWKKVLTLEAIPKDESFFNLGGHSLLAIEMFDRINDIFNLNLALAIIFKRDSISSMSAYIEKLMLENKKELQSLQTIVQIKSNNKEQTPIFCFHGIGGNVLNYYHLSLSVGDRPFYGVQSLGVNGDVAMPKSLVEMAEVYVDEIKIVQPEGPYLLAGGSMGGMIALEVAQQLKSRGDVVTNVIMFDTLGPSLDVKTYGKVDIHLSTRLRDSFKRHYQRIQSNFKHAFYQLTKTPTPALFHYKMVEEKNSAALLNYKTQNYDGDITLIRGLRGERGYYADPFLGWRAKIEGEIEIFEIPGDHDKFIESDEFSQCFKKVVTQY